MTRERGQNWVHNMWVVPYIFSQNLQDLDLDLLGPKLFYDILSIKISRGTSEMFVVLDRRNIENNRPLLVYARLWSSLLNYWDQNYQGPELTTSQKKKLTKQIQPYVPKAEHIYSNKVKKTVYRAFVRPILW